MVTQRLTGIQEVILSTTVPIQCSLHLDFLHLTLIFNDPKPVISVLEYIHFRFSPIWHSNPLHHKKPKMGNFTIHTRNRSRSFNGGKRKPKHAANTTFCVIAYHSKVHHCPLSSFTA